MPLDLECSKRAVRDASRNLGLCEGSIMLWTVVNERGGLGDEAPPDYLTSVRDGGFYGWPDSYWGQTVDDRVPQDPAAVARALTPDMRWAGTPRRSASVGCPPAHSPGSPTEW